MNMRKKSSQNFPVCRSYQAVRYMITSGSATCDFPEVSDKTVFNFVMRIRRKYGIGKSSEESVRQCDKLPETPPGQYAQVDFGEY